MPLPRPVPAAAVALLLALMPSCTHSNAPTATPPPTNTRSGPTASTPSPHPGRPNVVILLSDDQNFRIFDRDLMPNVFGRLVDQDAEFTRAYVNVSQCCPSRATI